MAYNMSYCRFENTLGALQECVEALDGEDLSTLTESEQKAACKLVLLCENLATDHIENVHAILRRKQKAEAQQ